MRISDWSSDVCSSDLTVTAAIGVLARRFRMHAIFVLSSQALGVLLVLNAGWGSSIVPTLDSIRTTAQAFVDSVDILQSYAAPVPPGIEKTQPVLVLGALLDRKGTRLNSSHSCPPR